MYMFESEVDYARTKFESTQLPQTADLWEQIVALFAKRASCMNPDIITSFVSSSIDMIYLFVSLTVVISLKSAVVTIVGPHTDESGLSTGVLFSISNVQGATRMFKLKGTVIFKIISKSVQHVLKSSLYFFNRFSSFYRFHQPKRNRSRPSGRNTSTMRRNKFHLLLMNPTRVWQPRPLHPQRFVRLRWFTTCRRLITTPPPRRIGTWTATSGPLRAPRTSSLADPPCRLLPTKYRLAEQIGQPGSFGRAHVAINLETGERCAVKLVSKKRLNPSAFELMRNEVLIMRRVTEFKSDFIIRFIEYFEDQDTLYLVMELATGGELFDQIVQRGTYTEQDAAQVAIQMFEAVRLLHAHDIVHADLKPDNFIFSSKGPDAKLKLIDFGQSGRLRPFERVRRVSGTGRE
jgi:hypothetical protein